jgi:hypothetical protein
MRGYFYTRFYTYRVDEESRNEASRALSTLHEGEGTEPALGPQSANLP